MINIRFINIILKILFLNICTFYVFIKITNFKGISRKNIFLLVGTDFITAMIYASLERYCSIILNTIILFLFISFIICFITKNTIESCLIIGMFSITISYVFFIVSGLISSFLADLIILNIPQEKPIGALIIFFNEIILLFFFFKTKRFKHGLAFLKNNKYNKYKFFPILIVVCLLILYSFLSDYRSNLYEGLIFGVILISIFFIIFIKKQITQSYKEILKEDTINQLENDLEAEKIKNEKISHELAVLAKINHKYSTRISALESYVNTSINKLNNNFNTEFADELFNAKELIENLSKEYTAELSEEFKYAKKLPKTNNLGLDNIINYLNAQANKDNIEFDLKINFEISCLIDNVILQNKLETLIADHIKDSIIAINHSNNKVRNIMLVFDKVNECYEIKIYDTGIEFEIDTLLKLGLQTVTTHKDTGGSGIGFMTTFETMKQCMASLIIEEYENNINNYTKSITIRFDGKNEYKIRSYRAYIIKKQSIDDRIVIEKL